MMNDPRGHRQDEPDPGLCGTCVHSQTIVSSKGSRFLMCRISAIDPRYPKYPQLPVRSCAAHQPHTD
jgi:hypothetical protein